MDLLLSEHVTKAKLAFSCPQVRSWTWQKILCKKQEEKKLTNVDDLSKHSRFSGFQELGTETNIRVKSGGFHVDMGDLFRYLEQHHSAYMFEEYFGVGGR